MITRLAHICLNVADIKKTIEFYNGKLGFPVKFTFERNNEVVGVYFEVGNGNFIEAFQVNDLKVINTGIVHFCLETDNIDRFIATMKNENIFCSEKEFGLDNTWQTWLQDPDGNRFEIQEYTDKSTQKLGGKIHVSW